MSRGYFGVAVYHPKTSANIGTLWRTAQILGADFIATIGQRYKHQASDTLKTPRHVPMFEYKSFEDFYEHLPYDSQLVAIELVKDACLVEDFKKRPQRAVYLLGAEDYGLPERIIKKSHHCIKLRGDRSMNVAVAGSIALYSHTIAAGANRTKEE